MCNKHMFLSFSSVYAGSAYLEYNTTVGRLNGNGYTGYQTKEISGANTQLYAHSVGEIMWLMLDF